MQCLGNPLHRNIRETWKGFPVFPVFPARELELILDLLSLSLSLQATFNNMRPLAHLLKTKNTTGNTGNTFNSETPVLMQGNFLYEEKQATQEIEKPETHGKEEDLAGNKSPPCGQRAFVEFSEGKTLVNRLEAVAIRAVNYAGALKDFSPEQKKIADLLDQAHEIEHAEPLDTVKLAKVIGELMAAIQKPEGLKSSEPGQQLLMMGT